MGVQIDVQACVRHIYRRISGIYVPDILRVKDVPDKIQVYGYVLHVRDTRPCR